MFAMVDSKYDAINPDFSVEYFRKTDVNSYRASDFVKFWDPLMREIAEGNRVTILLEDGRNFVAMNLDAMVKLQARARTRQNQRDLYGRLADQRAADSELISSVSKGPAPYISVTNFVLKRTQFFGSGRPNQLSAANPVSILRRRDQNLYYIIQPEFLRRASSTTVLNLLREKDPDFRNLPPAALRFIEAYRNNSLESAVYLKRSLSDFESSEGLKLFHEAYGSRQPMLVTELRSMGHGDAMVFLPIAP
jgi:hypothetical protein